MNGHRKLPISNAGHLDVGHNVCARLGRNVWANFLTATPNTLLRMLPYPLLGQQQVSPMWLFRLRFVHSVEPIGKISILSGKRWWKGKNHDCDTHTRVAHQTDQPRAFVHVRIRPTRLWAVPFFCYRFRASSRKLVSL